MWDLQTAGQRLETATSFRRVPGGAAANVALALRQRGIACAVAGTVSADAFGDGYLQSLEAQGVDVSAVVQRRGRMGLVFMEQARFLSYRPQFARWPSRLLLPKGWRRRIPPGSIIHLAALSGDTPELAPTWRLVERALGQGGRLSVDLNARPRAWHGRRWPQPARALLAHAQLVKASHEDLEVLGVTSDAEAARHALGITGTLVLTRGRGTSVAVGPWGRVARRPPRVATPQRSIGAGDAFCASLLAALVDPAADMASRRFWYATIDRANRDAAAQLGG
jgi:fructokinase